MNLVLTELLNLPGVMVEDFRQTEKELFLEVEVNAVKATFRAVEISVGICIKIIGFGERFTN